MASLQPIKRRQILVIDDDQIVRDFAVNTIAYGSNRRVMTFGNGLDAWQFVRSANPFDYCRQANPRLDGLALLTRIKDSYPQIYYILMSSNPSLERKAFHLGADAFLCKPFDVDDLFNIVIAFIHKTK